MSSGNKCWNQHVDKELFMFWLTWHSDQHVNDLPDTLSVCERPPHGLEVLKVMSPVYDRVNTAVEHCSQQEDIC